MDFPLSMPGSFLPDHDAPIRPTLTRASANTALFFPPHSPSASSSLSKSIYSVPRTISVSGEQHTRKRARVDPAWSNRATAALERESQTSVLSSTVLDAPSPAPLVNLNYRLAGGLDTPRLARDSDFDLESERQDYRQNRFTFEVSPTSKHTDYFPSTPCPLDRERNGRKRPHSVTERSSWTRMVYGVAGKIFNLCTSAFRGFHAGGGQGFHLEATTPSIVQTHDWTEIGERSDVFNSEYRGSTPVPGQFPQEAFIEDYMSRPRLCEDEMSTPTQMNGGGQTSVLRNNWVIIQNSDLGPRETSPVRKKPKPSTTPAISRSGLTTRPRLAHSRSSASAASFASLRGQDASPRKAHSRPSTADGQSFGHQRSRSSIASPRPLRHEGDAGSHSPMSPEVKHFRKRVKRQERVQEERIRRLTEQTDELLRMGREALGTRFEIQDGSDMEDEGYCEGREEPGEGKSWS